jgi:sirohydrochlorin cobaltochelatase
MGFSKMKAVIFFGHGARDIRWREPFDRLVHLWTSQSPDIHAKVAFLELMAPSLPEAIAEYSAMGLVDVVVIPVFFGQGGHLRKDLPVILENCRTQFPEIKLSTSPAVGESDEVLQSIIHFTKAQTL